VDTNSHVLVIRTLKSLATDVTSKNHVIYLSRNTFYNYFFIQDIFKNSLAIIFLIQDIFKNCFLQLFFSSIQENYFKNTYINDR